MNHAMTAGLDRRWRRLAAETVVRPGDAVLDACCGTGDLAIAAERAGGRVTGLDFSEQMLVRARGKSDSVEWVLGDVTALPFDDASFDAVTVGFGIRNVPDLEPVSRSSHGWSGRGGRVASLEITRPEGCSSRSSGSGSTASCLSPARFCPAGGRTPTSRRACGGSLGHRIWPRHSVAQASTA